MPNTRDLLDEFSFEQRRTNIFLIHLVLAVAVLSVVWFRRRDAQKPKAAGN